MSADQDHLKENDRLIDITHLIIAIDKSHQQGEDCPESAQDHSIPIVLDHFQGLVPAQGTETCEEGHVADL